MTDDEDIEFLKDLRARVFGEPHSDPINPDGRLTLDEVVEFSRRWQQRGQGINADIITDPDGRPLAVGESFPVYCLGLAISQADADRLGIDPADYPGIRIFPAPKGQS